MIRWKLNKMQPSFPAFQNHLDLAHNLWRGHLKPGDWAIDATCGNGRDTLVLARLVGPSGGVIAIDLQAEAIQAAKARVEGMDNVYFYCQSHETFPDEQPIKLKLIVYNLGYLPGGNKGLTTRVDSTLKSVKNALEILERGGLISITCYPGHAEGAREENALLDLVKALNPKQWSISYHQWINRKLAPALFLIQHTQ